MRTRNQVTRQQAIHHLSYDNILLFRNTVRLSFLLPQRMNRNDKLALSTTYFVCLSLLSLCSWQIHPESRTNSGDSRITHEYPKDNISSFPPKLLFPTNNPPNLRRRSRNLDPPPRNQHRQRPLPPIQPSLPTFLPTPPPPKPRHLSLNLETPLLYSLDRNPNPPRTPILPTKESSQISPLAISSPWMLYHRYQEREWQEGEVSGS